MHLWREGSKAKIKLVFFVRTCVRRPLDSAVQALVTATSGEHAIPQVLFDRQPNHWPVLCGTS